MTKPEPPWPVPQPFDRLNFLLTNRVPRALLTHLMGRLAVIERPAFVRLALAVWRRFGGLDLSEAARQDFSSIRDCFTRELRPGARPIDPRPAVMVAPCDAIVGACGRIEQGMLFQVKGSPYAFDALVPDPAQRAALEDAHFVTLRLTAAMYHRFHAPDTLRIETIDYINGDVWNVNPPALQRVPQLFCRNTRAVLRCRLDDGSPLLLVPVAAILVASLRLHCLPHALCRGYRGVRRFTPACDVRRGEELGWFEHGSTLIAIAPPNVRPVDGVVAGAPLRMGQALFQRVAA